MDIAKIPSIMRAQSPAWGNAARLMERWFAGAPAVKPAYAAPDTTTIRMDTWLLSFPRVRKLYDQKIVAEELWRTPKAEAQLALNLARAGLLAGGHTTFGHLGADITALDADYYQHLRVAASLAADPLDDLFGALANFQLRLLASGRIEAAPDGEHLVTVERYGVYVQDSYDFEDDAFALDKPSSWISQPLGYWNETAKSVSKMPGAGYDPVDNAQFRAWRKAKGFGGDFLVYSDVKVTAIPGGWTFRAMGAKAPPPKPPLSPTKIRTVRGDSLSHLARKHYGDWRLWPLIWDANRSAVGPRPSRLRIGVELMLPPLPGVSGARLDDARKRAPKWKNNEYADP
jgi:hypothetical protein